MSKVRACLVVGTLVVGAWVASLPFVWLVLTSFKKPHQVFAPFPRRPSPSSLARWLLPARQFARVAGRWYEGEVQQLIPGKVVVRLEEGPHRGSEHEVETSKLDGTLVVIPEAGIETFTRCAVVRTLEPVRRVVELYQKGVVPRDLVTVTEEDFRERVGFSLRNFRRVFLAFDVLRYTFNTLVVVSLSVVGTLLASSLCAYGFARLRFPGRDLLFFILLSTMMLPGIVLMIPTFHLWKYLGALDTYWPLVFPHFLGGAANAFYIFLLRQFFRTLPGELFDAARIDGCSDLGIWWRIVLPLSRPALAAVAVFVFIGAWNDFLGPLIYLFSPEKSTLALGLATFKSTYAGGGSHAATATGAWHLLMAASTVMTLPVVALFFLAQRYFVEGVTLTGLKG